MNCSGPVFTPAYCSNPLPILPPTAASSHNPQDASFASFFPQHCMHLHVDATASWPGRERMALALAKERHKDALLPFICVINHSLSSCLMVLSPVQSHRPADQVHRKYLHRFPFRLRDASET